MYEPQYDAKDLYSETIHSVSVRCHCSPLPVLCVTTVAEENMHLPLRLTCGAL